MAEAPGAPPFDDPTPRLPSQFGLGNRAGVPLSPEDVWEHPWDWQEISRAEAERVVGLVAVVVVTAANERAAGPGRALWYEQSAYVGGSGPFHLRSLRYYRYRRVQPIRYVERAYVQIDEPPPLAPGRPAPMREDEPDAEAEPYLVVDEHDVHPQLVPDDVEITLGLEVLEDEAAVAS